MICGWSNGGSTVATAVALWCRNPSGGMPLRRPWMKIYGRRRSGENQWKVRDEGVVGHPRGFGGNWNSREAPFMASFMYV